MNSSMLLSGPGIVSFLLFFSVFIFAIRFLRTFLIIDLIGIGIIAPAF